MYAIHRSEVFYSFLISTSPLTVDRRAPSELTDIVELKWLYLNGEMIWHARRTAGLGKTRIALNAVKDEKPEINTDPNIKLYSIPAGWPGHIAAFAMTKIGGEEMADEVKDLESVRSDHGLGSTRVDGMHRKNFSSFMARMGIRLIRAGGSCGEKKRKAVRPRRSELLVELEHGRQSNKLSRRER